MSHQQPSTTSRFAGPQDADNVTARWVQHEIEQTDRKASVIDEIAGAAGLVLLLIGAFFALHLA